MKRISEFLMVAIVTASLGVAVSLPSSMSPFEVPSMIGPVSDDTEQRSYCPSCGGLSEFIFLKDNGSAWLVCHDCGTEWLFQRIKCPYCGNEDPNTLSYFYAENEGMLSYRFYVCKVCYKYIKATDLRSAQSTVSTILQRSTVNQLEWEVQNRGYVLGWVK